MLRAYGRLFDDPRARRLLGASLVGRLAIGLFDLPLIVATEHATGSYAVAGAAVATFAGGVALTAPRRGRLLDRHGPRRFLPWLGIPSALAVAALTVAAGPGAATAPILVLAAVAGLVTPPFATAMRLEWQAMLGRGDPRLQQAYALETTLRVGVFIAGSLVAALGIALIGARAVLAVCAALTLAGAFGAAALGVARPAPAPAGPRRSPIRIAGVTTLALATACADVGLGAVDVAVTAFAGERDASWAAGLLLAGFAVSSALGSAAIGARAPRSEPRRRLLAIFLALAAGLALLAAAWSLPVLALFLLAAGAPSGIQWATVSVVLDDVAPRGSEGEAFNWLSTANATGFALGGLSAGVAVELGGPPLAFLAAAASVLAAAAIVAVRAATLRPSSPAAPPA